VQVPYDEGVAIHIGPESCAVAREGVDSENPVHLTRGQQRIRA